MLSDDVLLNILIRFLGGYSRFRPTFVHVSRRWRQILFASSLGRALRLHQPYGMSVLNTQDYRPMRPIIQDCGRSPTLDSPAANDEDSVVAALKQSFHITSISLAVTGSLLEKLSAIKLPFFKLEDLVLLSRDNVQLILPIGSYFQWGPRLRRLRLTGIAFPALLQCISYSKHLVDIQLHLLEISHTMMGWLSPGEFANALSQTSQLQSLLLHLPSTTVPIPPSSGERVLLPVLTHLNLQGFTGYLEGLGSRIDAPNLRDIEITFFDDSIFDVPKLRDFIDQIEMQKSHCRADILSSEHSISISLTQPGAPTRLKLQVLCRTSDLLPLFMAQICTYFSAFLCRVEDLHICAMRTSNRQGGTDFNRASGQWLELIRRFRGAKWFHVSGEHSLDIIRTVQPDERHEIALPSLHKLHIREPVLRGVRLREAIAPFIYSCRVSRCFIAVELEYERLQIDGFGGAGIIYA